MSNSPLVSIIIPVYKVEPYLDRCINSTVNQTYKNIEIILIDDGSPDNCPIMCDKWCQKDSRIKVIHKKNGGLSDARNAGLEIVQGEYILFVDSDDWIDENTVETLLKKNMEDKADIVICGIYLENKTDTVIPNINEKPYYDKDILRIFLMDNIRPEVSCKLYSRSIIGDLRFDTHIRYAEDVPFNYTLFKKAKKVITINQPKYHYNLTNEQSITSVGMNEHRAKLYRIFSDFIYDCKNDKNLYNAAVFRYSVVSFSLLSMILLNKEDTEKYYNEIADDILLHKSEILKNPLCSTRKKSLTFLLSINKKLFKSFVRIIRGL